MQIEHEVFFKRANRFVGLPVTDQLAVIRAEHSVIGKDARYNVYGDTIHFYQRDFDDVLKGQKIIDFLNGREAPVVIDLLAPSETIFDLFRASEAKGTYLGIAVTLEERRGYGKRNRDKNWNITQINGDITQPQTCRNLLAALNGKRADLIMERALHGLMDIPIEETYYRRSLQRIWQLLKPNGGMFLGQTLPHSMLERFGVNPQGIKDELTTQGVSVDVTDSTKDHPYGAFRLTRTPDAPSTIAL